MKYINYKIITSRLHSSLNSTPVLVGFYYLQQRITARYTIHSVLLPSYFVSQIDLYWTWIWKKPKSAYQIYVYELFVNPSSLPPPIEVPSPSSPPTPTPIPSSSHMTNDCWMFCCQSVSAE